MVSDDVISMPDKWEYPWYAAWDLAFHSIPLALVDPDFAKKQLLLLLQERYLHPNGQVPAYEWNFGDVNPPVHAWAAYFLYQIDKRRTGHGDLEFLQQHLQQAAAQLHLVGQPQGSRPGATCSRAASWASTTSASSIAARRCPPAVTWNRPTATAWMAFYAQTMLQSRSSSRSTIRSYVDMALKFFEHFVWIASAMIHIGGQGEMWDERGRVLLRRPAHARRPGATLKVRSMVGLLPLCAATVIERRGDGGRCPSSSTAPAGS